MRDKKIAVMFFTRGGSYCECKGHDASRKSLNAWRYCTESTKSIHRTALYRQCNLPETRRTLFSFSFSFLLLSLLFILHEGISRRREIDRILRTLLPIKISFACHTPLYRYLFITFFPQIYALFFFFFLYQRLCKC